MARKISGCAWLITLLLSWANWVWAQNRPTQFVFSHIQEKDGLSANSAKSFLQDRDGFIWVGTTDGLNRYDGNQFIHFKHKRNDPHSLPSNTIYDLCEDQQGNIWMGVDNGVSRYNKQTGQFFSIATVNTRTLGAGANILCDRRGDIWFTSHRAGLYRYVTKTGQIQHFPYDPTADPLTTTSFVMANGFLEDPTHNALWIADGYGLHYFDIDSRQFVNHKNNPQRLPIFTDHYITGLALDGDLLYFADNADQQIVVYSLAKQQIVKTIKTVGMPFNQYRGEVATLFIDRQHNLWVSSYDYRAYHIDGRSNQATELLHQKDQPTAIGSGLFLAGWQHPDGSVWLGTVNGISITNPERAFYSVYDIQKLYPSVIDEEGISRPYEDNDGSWWLGTRGRGLIHYWPQTNRLRIYKLPDDPVNHEFGGFVAAIVPYGDTLFIGANIGFSQLDKRTHHVRKIPYPADWKPSSLRCGFRHKDQIWIGNAAGQAYTYSPRTGQWRQYPVRRLSETGRVRVDKFFLDAGGHLWAHIEPQGFARFDPKQGHFTVDKPVPHPDYLPNVAHQMVAGELDQQGNLWIAANGYGLWRYNLATRTYTNWMETEGLIYDHNTFAIPDATGRIWVGAYNKFSVFSPQTKHFINFTLPYNQANFEYSNRFIRLRNGHLLTTLKGYLVEFDPNKLVRYSSTLSAKVLISRVDVDETTHLVHSGLSSITLQPGQTRFSVRFGALTSPTETPLTYLYQLEGYEEDWKRIDKPADIIYNHMPGGTYRFLVKAATAEGRHTPTTALTIRVDAPLYQTRWFQGLLLLIVIGLMGAFLRHRAWQTAQFHALQIQASRLERDKTEIQYQNLINHLNPHFLFNSLTSLNSLININPQGASTFLRKLSIIYRYILQNKDNELVTLESELTFVQHYIDLQISRFRDALQIDVAVAPATLTYKIVPVTVQNLLENAIKHNTLDRENPLYIHIYTKDTDLYVSNVLQKKDFVETSNKQGLSSLLSLYRYLSPRPIDIIQTETTFIVKIPLLS